jgi:hypothetical protein
MVNRLCWILAMGMWVVHSSEAAPDTTACKSDQSRTACDVAWLDQHLRLNELQAIGTHNSYKQAISPGELALLKARSPQAARALDYSHAPLTEQLDAGARQVEIDILDDPDGGLYASPRMRQVAALMGTPLTPFDATPLQAPGFKVLHVQDLDYRSNCATLALCLAELHAWSQAHPRHVPILVMMNLKRGASPVPGGVEARAFDADAFDRLDAAVRTLMPAKQIITPDEVQGRYPTLREAVRAGNWPTLGAARGRFLFALDEPYEIGVSYQGKRTNLEGRVFFVNAPESSTIAAYITLNDPIAQADRIRAAVADGLLVRTRADAETEEARNNDTRRREAALGSGAHYVSTDYMQPREEFGPYRATLPGATAARCNPVRCSAKAGQEIPEVP